MRPLSIWFQRLRNLFRKEQLDRDLQDELASHLEMHIADNLRSGMTPEEARRIALLTLGGLEQTKESVRDQRTFPFLESLLQDVRFALRMLRKSPAFTVVAILTISLGIGGNAAIFSLMQSVLSRPLPVHNPEELALLSSSEGYGYSNFSFSYPMYRDLRGKNDVLSGLVARSGVPMNLVFQGASERVRGELVSGDYFSVLGVRPWIGRLLDDADDENQNASPVAVISYDFWKLRFGSDASIVNRKIILNDHSFIVIGVTPPGFYGTDLSNNPAVQVPFKMTPLFVPLPFNRLQSRAYRWLTVMGRRKPDVPLAQAQASMEILFHQLRAAEVSQLSTGSALDHERFLRVQLKLTDGSRGFLHMQQQFRRPLFLLLAVTTIVLLILTANLANMLLARTVARKSETAVRLALGATQSRLLQQWLTESVITSFAGGAAGVIVAFWSKSALVAFLPADFQTNLQQPLNLGSFGFALGVAILMGLFIGLAPGLRASRSPLSDVMRGEAPSIVQGAYLFNLRSLLLALQVALCLPLLIGAGLFLHSLRNLRTMDPGFAKENILLANLDPSLNQYSPDRVRNLFNEILERVRSTPGVRSASLATYSPISGGWDTESVIVEGYQPRDGETMNPNAAAVSSDYFKTLGIPITSGREFSETDLATSPKVAVINESMAHYFFGDRNPLGKHIDTNDTPGAKPTIEIVGVVRDAKYVNLKEHSRLHFYVPLSQIPHLFDLTLHIKTVGDPIKSAELIRDQVHQVDPNLPLYEVKTLSTQIDESLTQDRLVSWLTSLFGFLATFLAAIGIYGVVAFTVLRRTREIGIRIALGATRQNVLWLILRQILAVVGVGTAIGLGLAIAMTKLLQSMLYELKPSDPITFSAAALVLFSSAALAAYLPARRATRVDPIIALRYE